MNDNAEAAVPETVNEALERLLTAVGPARAAGIERAVLQCLQHETGSEDDWHAALRAALASGSEKGGGQRFDCYRDAFPAAYREMFPPRSAAEDVPAIERLLETGGPAVDVYRPPASAPNTMHLRLYEPARPTALSVLLPHLENMGLAVAEHFACPIHPAHAPSPICFQDFAMVSRDGTAIDLDAVAAPFRETFLRLLNGDIEDDGFNGLVVRAAFDWRAVTMLRAYCRYLRQLGCPFSEPYIERALARNPALARGLVDLFDARFSPAAGDDRAARVEVVARGIQTQIDDVASIDEERILNRYLELIQATVRTNYYQRGRDGGPKPYLSFKIDSQAIREMPAPRPLCEIFVYSPRVQGVHLRGGRVARGGLRWSDRPEDLRTEILGLLKAQRVKNVVIVPQGAKGGFVLKGRSSVRPTRDDGVAGYETFVRGLLDLTDNVVRGRTAPLVAETVRWDDADPYLVVAADKGTATFSDIANQIAREYGFWLDDAFASGGSAGYDHKQMGITARGVWEAVKRHFRELGKDIGRETFTVAAVGDMSGDVFGNGMLLSRRIRLIGAFDHRHVFLDPDPDPGTSFAERRRLFQLGASSWQDYNPALISAGGGVFPRDAKSVTLSPEIRAALGTDAARLHPDELIRALLRAPVDLLWLGGIGTYVKAAEETHADASDRANDAVRIDARELQCKVIGEGANLGLTQRARIEFALAGGRINTDAIDNAAGVNCSDHEVNIKILLNAAVAAGRLDRAERDRLLATMTEEVAELVLRDNYLQTQAISVTEAQAVDRIDRHARLMDMLERTGQLDRRLMHLPGTDELVQRRASGLGLTRPEIAVLLAHTKLSIYEALLASDLPDDPLLVDDLVRYFPTPLRFPYRDLIENHPLRREIIATGVMNSMVNRVGSGFVNDMMEKTGLGDADAAKAYAIARDTFELRPLWRGIEALDNVVPAALQTAMLLEIGRLVEHATLWFLRRCRHPLDISATVERFAIGVAELAAMLPGVLPDSGRAAFDEQTRAYRQAGVPDALAARIAALPFLTPALDIVSLAGEHGVAVETAARRYFELGDRLGLDDLRARARTLTAGDTWEREAGAALQDDLAEHQRRLASSVISSAGAETDPLARWADHRRHAAQRLLDRIDQLRGDAALNLARLVVVNREIRALAEAGA